jgi:hypothetical protein
MKRVTLLVLTVLAVASVVPAAQETKQRRFIWDSGIITPGPNQILRLIITAAGTTDTDLLVRFTKMAYVEGACSGDVCRSLFAGGSTSDLIRLGAGEAASIDVPPAAFAVRGIVYGSRRNARVTYQIIDAVTGEVVAAKWYVPDMDSDSSGI